MKRSIQVSENTFVNPFLGKSISAPFNTEFCKIKWIIIIDCSEKKLFYYLPVG
jgi:hypothetical protein